MKLTKTALEELVREIIQEQTQQTGQKLSLFARVVRWQKATKQQVWDKAYYNKFKSMAKQIPEAKKKFKEVFRKVAIWESDNNLYQMSQQKEKPKQVVPQAAPKTRKTKTAKISFSEAWNAKFSEEDKEMWTKLSMEYFKNAKKNNPSSPTNAIKMNVKTALESAVTFGWLPSTGINGIKTQAPGAFKSLKRNGAI